MNKLLFLLFLCYLPLPLPLALALALAETKSNDFGENSDSKVDNNDFDFFSSNYQFGAHGIFFKAANANNTDLDTQDTSDPSFGYGIEFAMPFDENLDLRFSLRNIPIATADDFSNQEDETMLAIEAISAFAVLPIYVVAGVNYFDYQDSPVSLNLGTGLRYHFSQRFYSYLETKLYFNLGDSSSFFAVNLGVVYHFSDSAPSIKDYDLEPKDATNTASKKSAVRPVIASAPTANSISAEDNELDDFEEKQYLTVQIPSIIEDCESPELITSGKSYSLYFEQDELTISTDNAERIECVADILVDNLATIIHVDGFVFEDDPVTSNVYLSRQRSLALKKYLMAEYGIEDVRIRITRHGEEQDIISKDVNAIPKLRRIEYYIEVIE
ncbi:hypothetical protein A9Q98_08315 [Thalassotalea sp. 42_200_T64]|nr:hypothetical protein A9Q98_08315 [Thalassotalea sp. 42_200_T64]